MFINPCVDFAFKKLFGDENNKDILISFLNSVLSEANQVVEVTLLNPMNHRVHFYDHASILDVKATDEKGRLYNIEMQVSRQAYFNQRVLYYWSKLYTSQLRKSSPFNDLNKTICINVLNFTYFNHEPHYHNKFKVLSETSQRSYFDDFELHFIELTKFDDDLTHIKTALDRWVTFLNKANYYDRDTIPVELDQEPAIHKAFKTLNEISLTEAERELYENSLKLLRDERAVMSTAREEGLEEGLEKGLEKGRLEEKCEIARQMLSAHVDEAAILKFTGLSQSELDQLKQ